MLPDLQNHEEQIERYLKKSGSEIGILYNYHDIIAYTKKDAVFTSSYLNSLKDIPPLILQNSNKLEKDILEFEKAVNGSFDSFIYLIKKYGEYKLNTIIFRLKSEQLPVLGAFFESKDHQVNYLRNGKIRQSFNSQDFEKLVSIIY
ncbi:MAG: hypothetical protein RMZ41_031000 [Nostoc sp. DedVER02]|uniref:hypothetical protein n=1 Tax=unclassified Nostoc TaxID=2593658 RepID=UPI002AD393A2|nr:MULTISPECIES: hypothetical protein [unclassified Nostoc]MDZ7989129.1 hypothetical protein [Nostoc sp. DedVER02]MDZ8111665.1 hypothetical protein [Nostoc sp. DedVER01b]